MMNMGSAGSSVTMPPASGAGPRAKTRIWSLDDSHRKLRCSCSPRIALRFARDSALPRFAHAGARAADYAEVASSGFQGISALARSLDNSKGGQTKALVSRIYEVSLPLRSSPSTDIQAWQLFSARVPVVDDNTSTAWLA